mmetsp:Transcript_28507/g.65221  ORF Transcript_28507/g.65221 Transcript_28507/m.65221 type:complete len:208 (-) Transcript_28507:340-963(-)
MKPPAASPSATALSRFSLLTCTRNQRRPSRPYLRCASCLLMPTAPTSGRVKVTRGTTVRSGPSSPRRNQGRRAFLTAPKPCHPAKCEYLSGRLVTSPAAEMPLAEVRPFVSTTIPAEECATPAFLSSKDLRLGARPVATRMWLPVRRELSSRTTVTSPGISLRTSTTREGTNLMPETLTSAPSSACCASGHSRGNTVGATMVTLLPT